MTSRAGRLANKVALVTGGARGQGASHARAFCEEGAAVVIGDVLHDEGAKLAASLQERGFAAEYAPLDVRDDEAWRAAVALAETTFGRLDVLVNNAGIVSKPGVEDETLEHWNLVVAVNQTGPFLGMRAAVPAMRRAGGGSIINISSIHGVTASVDHLAYHASKGALILMSKSAALTLATAGIRVNTVCPGAIWTPMMEPASPAFRDSILAATPMHRFGTSEEVSAACVFLASDESSFVTGSELVVDGGFLAQ